MKEEHTVSDLATVYRVHPNPCAYLSGAVCPGRAVAAGLVLPLVNAEAINAHRAKIARSVAPAADASLVLDGASWHGARALTVLDNISLPPLPPQAPELNSVENVRARLHANKVAISAFESHDAIDDACCTARNFFANDPEAIATVTSRPWAQVS